MRPHRQQPIRLPCPWDSPGKNSGVGCHFLLQCMKVKNESEVAQSCPTLSGPMDCSLPGSSVYGIFQAKSTGVGCHCLLQPMTTEEFAKCDSRDFFFSFVSVCLVAQSCPTLCDLIDCSPPGSSVHGILQARVLNWFAISFSVMTNIPLY